MSLESTEYEEWEATKRSMIESTGGGYVPSNIFNEVPVGVRNGSNKVFVLSYLPTPNSLAVYWNGILLEPTDDYTISEKQLTLSVAPSSSDKLRARYNH